MFVSLLMSICQLDSLSSFSIPLRAKLSLAFPHLIRPKVCLVVNLSFYLPLFVLSVLSKESVVLKVHCPSLLLKLLTR